MAQSFEDITRDVVNRFLQNILFVDDNAYRDDGEKNTFDAQKVSSVFAQRGKLCTVYAPTSTKDLENCSSLFAKSDVIVLDWYLNLNNDQHIDNEEEDSDSEEPRGIHTIKLIKNIVEDASDKKIKLVVVYTGETDLNGITE